MTGCPQFGLPPELSHGAARFFENHFGFERAGSHQHKHDMFEHPRLPGSCARFKLEDFDHAFSGIAPLQETT